MTTVAIIPAKGTSRRIPNKNRRLFHGKPIIAYSIEAAKASGLFDEVWVSSDDWEIGGLAQRLGAKFYPRPHEYALDAVGTQEVTAECLRELGRVETWRPEYACCIYATAPLLLPSDLQAGFALLGEHPYTYVQGLYYWGRTDSFLRDVPLSDGYEVPFPAGRYIDINTEDDWRRAEEMYAALNASSVGAK